MSNKIKLTAREQMLIDVFGRELDEKREHIARLQLLLDINSKYLKYTSLKFYKPAK